MIPALRGALQGRFTGRHALLIGQMLAQIDFLTRRSGPCLDASRN